MEVLLEAISSENVNILKMLIDSGAELDVKNLDEVTLLHEAAEYRDLSILKFLLEAVPDYIRAKNSRGNTPLHAAAQNENINILKSLLEAGAKTDERNTDGDHSRN